MSEHIWEVAELELNEQLEFGESGQPVCIQPGDWMSLGDKQVERLESQRWPSLYLPGFLSGSFYRVDFVAEYTHLPVVLFGEYEHRARGTKYVIRRMPRATHVFSLHVAFDGCDSVHIEAWTAGGRMVHGMSFAADRRVYLAEVAWLVKAAAAGRGELSMKSDTRFITSRSAEPCGGLLWCPHMDFVPQRRVTAKRSAAEAFVREKFLAALG